MDNPQSRSVPRRQFLLAAGVALGGWTVAKSFWALQARADRSGFTSPPAYGDLVPAKDETTGLELIKLPRGFRYVTFGWTGDPLDDGTPTPPIHDGMGVIGSKAGQVTLCRNHEISGFGKPIGPPAISYDAQGKAGCTNLQFDTKLGKLTRAWVGISGTVRNCAGGATPWGTWLTCEETVLGPGDIDDNKTMQYEQDHGFIFEVPADGTAAPVPYKEMGRFVHEAVAVDPKTGMIYETEDRKTAGFYRFTPKVAGQPGAGGRLQMMRVKGHVDLRGSGHKGESMDVGWVDIEDPLRAHSPGTKDELGVYSQGKAQGGTTFARLEGCCHSEGLIYLAATSGGWAGKGQIWEYAPADERIRLVFESSRATILDNPDNLTVSPRGGLVLCEDGDLPGQRLHGLTPAGVLFPLVESNMVLKGERNGHQGDFRAEEWAGVCFSPDGEWLFVNAQNPGLTLAITGPWKEGGL